MIDPQTPLKYQIQGQLYPMIHYRVDKLLKSSFKGVSEDKIFYLFFHCIRLGKLFLPKEKLFPLYKKALIEALYLINEENYLVYNLKKEYMFFFGHVFCILVFVLRYFVYEIIFHFCRSVY